ncbi:MAG: hypothetical protein ABSC32_18020 [Steroidobacteraceae bacterium]
MTLLDAPELPSKLLINSLSPVSVARLVSAATVDATLVEVLPAPAPALAEVAAATVFCAEAALDALKRLDRAEAELLLTLPIDIITPIATL